MKKAMFMTIAALGVTALLMAQDASKFNGTWKGDGGQVRKLTYKDGVVYMEEMQTNGTTLTRSYSTNGKEVLMTDGIWKDSKAVGKMEGNKLIVDTVQGSNGAVWHDEWTMAEDGKSYSALRQLVTPGTGGGKGPGGPVGGKGPGGPGGGAPPTAGPGGGGPGGGKGKGGGGGGPETFTKIQ